MNFVLKEYSGGVNQLSSFLRIANVERIMIPFVKKLSSSKIR